jgi:hypothetical protein
MTDAASTLSTAVERCKAPLDFGESIGQDVGMVDGVVKVEEVGEPFADVGHGLIGPSFVRVVAQFPEYPGLLDVRVLIEPIDGTYEVTELSLSNQKKGIAIPPDALRKIPMRTIVRMALGNRLLNANLREVLTPAEPEPIDRSPEANMHRNVALRYRIARLVGGAPVEAVQKAQNVSRATATRRVAAARKAGFLGQDEIGQAGGARSRLEN